MSPVLLRVLTDLFILKPCHSREELKQFEEIVSHLLLTSHPSTRRILAEKLAMHPETPLRILQQLLEFDDEGAHFLLTHCPYLPLSLLHHLAQNGTFEQKKYLAGRTHLDEETIRLLARMQEPDLLLSLLTNHHAPVSPKLLQSWIGIAYQHPPLAQALCARWTPQHSPAPLLPLFFYASSLQRQSLIKIAQTQAFVERQSFFFLLETEEEDHLESLSRAQNYSLFKSYLCSFLTPAALDFDFILDDPSGDGLALILSLLGVQEEKGEHMIQTFFPHPPSPRIIFSLHPRVARWLYRVIFGLFSVPARPSSLLSPYDPEALTSPSRPQAYSTRRSLSKDGRLFRRDITSHHFQK